MVNNVFYIDGVCYKTNLIHPDKYLSNESQLINKHVLTVTYSIVVKLKNQELPDLYDFLTNSDVQQQIKYTPTIELLFYSNNTPYYEYVSHLIEHKNIATNKGEKDITKTLGTSFGGKHSQASFSSVTKVIENNKSIKRLYGKIDRLLIDSPCSGLGVLKRNPDSKWKLSQEFLEKIKNTQQEILQKYAPLIKNNGKLVYATCSILPSENEIQIESFLKSNIGLKFKKEDEKKISPSKTGFDGFYMARLSLK